jgi:hypothetical protein
VNHRLSLLGPSDSTYGLERGIQSVLVRSPMLRSLEAFLGRLSDDYRNIYAFVPTLRLGAADFPTAASRSSFILPGHHCPDQSVYPPRYSGKPEVERAAQDRGLFDLSTRKVYPAPDVTTRPVSSYLTISPFPVPKNRVMVVYFLWHFLSCPDESEQSFPLGSTPPCVARTFLPFPLLLKRAIRADLPFQSSLCPSLKPLRR